MTVVFAIGSTLAFAAANYGGPVGAGILGALLGLTLAPRRQR